MFHNVECLDAFRLTICDYGLYHDRYPDFNRWIRHGLSLVAGNFLSWASISVWDFSRSATMLLGSLSNVRSLKLKGITAAAILDKELDEVPTFGSLRTFCLNWWE
ncbi:hypothetical protein EJB05_37866, partial [Eragrostis curvula]